MASVGEVKAHLSHAIMRGGEGYAALEGIRTAVGEAIESLKEASEVMGVVSDGTMDDDIHAAVARYIEAESKARAIIQFVDDAQAAAMTANESAGRYLGMLG